MTELVESNSARSPFVSSARCFVLFFIWTLTVSAQTNVVIPPAGKLLQSLRPEHPRLFARREQFDDLKKRVATVPLLASWRDQIRAEAEKIISAAPSIYEIPDGLRLLNTSRRVLRRMQTLGLMYQLEGDRRCLERAWLELEAAARFPDWNPRHFLDTAEMTHAFALGYDWFYDAWTPGQRKVIRTALVEKGLKVALDVYRGTAKTSRWPLMHHNWNQVCNGGIGIGALAVASEEPALAAELLSDGLNSIQLAMTQFAPDGAWAEGPGYWNYATSYNVALLAALESALGTDFGLAKIPGFADSGTFPIYVTGPLGKTFNYADGSEGAIHAPQMFWLGKKFLRPEYGSYERAVVSVPEPLDLLWCDNFLPSTNTVLSLDKYFRKAEVVTLRSAWTDRRAVFVGFKAGDNKANHSNLDLGSFVMDADGVRWFIDLGADNYNLPGYFGAQRWTYYRMRAEGHNTLVLNPTIAPDQDPRAAAGIVHYDSKPQRAFAIADLSTAYPKVAGRTIRRGIELLGRKQVLIQDEVSGASSAQCWWFAHTAAQIELSGDGAIATLSQGNKKLIAQILSPPNISFRVMDAIPLPSSPQPAGQNENRNIHKLAIQAAGLSDLRLVILLRAAAEDALPAAKKIVALKDW
jgi:hypothetical protein